MIRTIALWFAGFVLCFVLQSTVLERIAIFGIYPDLLIIALFLLSLKNGAMAGIYTGFVIGLVQDIYSEGMLGQAALSKTVVGFFAGLFNERMIRTHPLVKLLLLAVAFLIHDGLFFTVETFKSSSQTGAVFFRLATESIPRGIYSAVIYSVIFVWDQYFGHTIRRYD